MPSLRALLDFARGNKLLEDEKPLEGRLINTSHGGPNMPKYQPCSIEGCGLSSKRVQKTRGGANYTCRRHGKFFVRAM